MPKLKHKTGEDAVAADAAKSSKSVHVGMTVGSPLSGDGEDNEVGDTKTFNIPYDDKVIICQRLGQDGLSSPNRSPLIFTHGAGGGIETPATKDFCEGFALSHHVLLFQGTMNLQSRVQRFHHVIEHENSSEVLGGRSMGARAAVVAGQKQLDTKALILVSYPLTSKRDVRDQILLNLKTHTDVLFITGDRDEMCNIDHLNQVRKKMKAQTWLVVVQGADHGMSMTPKHAAEIMRRRTGEIAAEWLRNRNDENTEIVLCWNKEKNDLEPAKGSTAGFDIVLSTPTKRKRESSPRAGGQKRQQSSKAFPH